MLKTAPYNLHTYTKTYKLSRQTGAPTWCVLMHIADKAPRAAAQTDRRHPMHFEPAAQCRICGVFPWLPA